MRTHCKQLYSGKLEISRSGHMLINIYLEKSNNEKIGSLSKSITNKKIEKVS